jgi:hypothetical protein
MGCSGMKQEIASLRQNFTVSIWPLNPELMRLTFRLAPAQDALEYKVTKFESSIYGGETEYQGPPTEHNNRLWKQTYARMYRPTV